MGKFGLSVLVVWSIRSGTSFRNFILFSNLIVQVQAVLLLLGGYEIPSGVPSSAGVSVNQRVSGLISVVIVYLLCIHFYFQLTL